MSARKKQPKKALHKGVAGVVTMSARKKQPKKALHTGVVPMSARKKQPQRVFFLRRCWNWCILHKTKTLGGILAGILAGVISSTISLPIGTLWNSMMNRPMDDLILSIPTLIGHEDGERFYSDVIFTNNGRRDATLAQRQLAIWPKNAPAAVEGLQVLGWNAWDTDFSDKTMALPAQKQTPSRFQFYKDFLKGLRRDYEMPQDFELRLFCSVQDADGHNHIIDRRVGMLQLTATDWSVVRSLEEDKSVCLLPSEIFGQENGGVGEIQINPALQNPKDLNEGRVVIPIDDIIKDIEHRVKQ